jgi:hypothetical protein
MFQRRNSKFPIQSRLPNRLLPKEKLEKKNVEDDDFVKLADLYAKIRDFYPETKKQSNVSITGDCAKVMIVTNSGTDEEWERKVAEQQQKLLSDGN